ncbi:MAG: hypothetical protein NTX72_00775, partial [Candidatus Uhrbacteria bacterium]|nr:hypothetical protein [Candidatus Uhrbacteria bacterium]
MSTQLRRQFASFLIIVTCLVTMVRVVNAAAVAPPNIVSYQGRLLNASGVPVTDGSLSIKFKLYDAPTAGTCLWTNSSSTCASSTARSVTLSSGLFSENLGDTGASYAPILPTVFSDNDAVYLGITIGSDSEMTPRKRMTAAPYAMNAQTLDGIDSTSFVRNDASIPGASPLTFEGATNNAFQTTFSFTDPTVDRTVTFQDASGTVAYLSDIGGGVTPDSLDFTDFSDTMALDASTSITQTGALSLSFNNNSSANTIFNLQSTGDFVVQDNGTPAFQVNDGGRLHLDATSAQSTGITGVGNFLTADTMSVISNASFPADSSSGNGGTLIGQLFDYHVANSSATVVGVFPTFASTQNGKSFTGFEFGGGLSTFAPTNTTGINDVNAFQIDGITDPGSTITSKAINIGDGWDTDIVFGSNAVLQMNGTTLTYKGGSDTLMTLTHTSGTGNLQISGDLTIAGDDLFMTTNTSGFILVADGTNYNPVGVSGDVSLSSTGLTTIGASAINSSKIADNSIVNADINSSAGILYSKLSLSNSILPTDLTSGDYSAEITSGTYSINISGNAATTTTNANLTGDVTSVGNATTIGASTVNSSKIADATIVSGDIADGTILNANLFNNTLDFDKFANTMLLDAATTIQAPAGKSLSIAATAAPTADLFTVSNSGFATSSNINGFHLNYAGADASSTAMKIDSAFSASFGGQTYAALDLGAFSPTSGGGGGTTVIGANIEGITDPDPGVSTMVNSIALALGDGWDTQLLFGAGASKVMFANTGSLEFEDAAFNNMMTLTDSGTTGDLSVTGNSYIGAGKSFDTNAAGALSIGNVNATSLAIGNASATSAITTSDWGISTTGALTGIDSISGSDNQGSIIHDIQVTRVNASTHSHVFEIDGSALMLISATGDGGGGINSRTIEMGTSSSDTIHIASASAAAADTIAIGNSNASSTLTLTGGAAWNMAAAGFLTLGDGQGIDTSSGATQGISLGYTYATLVNIGSTAAANINIGNRNLGDSSLARTIRIADETNTHTIDVGGVNYDGTDTVNIATSGATNADTVNIGNTNSGSLVRIYAGNTLDLNSVAGTKTTNIGGSGGNSGTDTVNIATNGTLPDTIAIGNTNASTTLALTGGTAWSVSTAGLITSADDLALNGGDITTSSATFNILNTATTKTINIGGTSTSGVDTVNIATNGTAADTISVGNSGSATSVTIDGGGVVGGLYLNDNGNGVHKTFIGGNDGFDGADTIKIANDATSADTITIGNSNATTTLALTSGTWAMSTAGALTGVASLDTIVTDATHLTFAAGGTVGATSTNALALSSGATTGTTSTSAITLNDTALTTGTLLYGDLRNVSGTALNFAYGAAKTLSGNMTGLTLDLQTNVTNVAETTTGISVLTPTTTGLTTGKKITGISVETPGAVTSAGGAGNMSWSGVSVESPSITQGAGTSLEASNYFGKLSVANVTTGGTLNGIKILPIGTTSTVSTINGVNVGSITDAGAGITNGVSVGSGWDNAISGTTAGTNLISFTNFTVTTAGAITGTFATANTERLCWDASGSSAITDCTGTPGDYAEQYGTTDPAVVAGDIVALDTSKPSEQTIDEQGIKGSKAWILKSSTMYQANIAGIVSTSPNEVIGENFAPEENPRPVALNGRVPVNVTNENGPISVGDYIAASSTPGKGMKATKAGRVVGIALGNFDGVSGQVIVQVNNSWYFGSIIGTDGTSTMLTDNVIVAPVQNATAGSTSFDSYGLALRGSAWDGNQAQTVSMMFKNKVTDGTSYRLSVRNTTDSEVAYITNSGTMQVAGDMVVGGKLYPSNLGGVQTEKYIYYDGSAGPGGDFMRTNGSG